jgi:hypothetical protein
VPLEQVLLRKDISQIDFDMLSLNLRVEAGRVKDFRFEWKFEVSPFKMSSSMGRFTIETPL